MNDLVVTILVPLLPRESSQYVTIRILEMNGEYRFYDFTSLFLVCALHLIYLVQFSQIILLNTFLRLLKLQCFYINDMLIKVQRLDLYPVSTILRSDFFCTFWSVYD